MNALIDENKTAFTDLDKEYVEAWSIFSDAETIKCFRDSLPFLKDIQERHLKIMGDNAPLPTYRTRFQKCLEYLFKKGIIKNAAPCIAEKLVDVIKMKGSETAILYLTQAIIRFLLDNCVIFARRLINGPKSGEDGVYII